MAEPRDFLVNSIIGAGSAIDGDIDIDGILRVDGDLRGSVRVTGKVVVGSRARIEATIRAHSAIIGGVVKGDVYVSERLRVLSGAVIVGNVFAPSLEMEEGTVVHGAVVSTGRVASSEVDLKAFVEAHGDSKRFAAPFRANCFVQPRKDPEPPAGRGRRRP